MGSVEVGVEWILSDLWVKEKDYGNVVLFLWDGIEFLTWRVSGIDRLKMAWLCGF